MDSKIFEVVLETLRDAFPLPEFSDQAATRVWVQELAGDAVDLAYSLGGSEQALVQIPQLQAAIEVLTEEEFQAKMTACCSANVEKFGDGQFIERIKKIDWANVMKIVMTIISMIPKTTPSA